jgi:uncharacterized coiled-coil DUF342 family protein
MDCVFDMKGFRDFHNLGQQDIRKVLGCSQSTVSKMENTRQISSKYLNRLKDHYGNVEEYIRDIGNISSVANQAETNEYKNKYVTLLEQVSRCTEQLLTLNEQLLASNKQIQKVKEEMDNLRAENERLKRLTIPPEQERPPHAPSYPGEDLSFTEKRAAATSNSL